MRIKYDLPLLVVAVLLVVLFLFLPACSTLNAAETPNTPRNQVKLLKGNEGGSCSGVVIAPELILTAKHCNALGEFTVDGKPAFIEAESRTADMMIVRAHVTCPCATIFVGPLEIDEPVMVVGFPLDFGVQYVTYGHYQGESEYGMALSADAAPGNSGGGVYVFREGQWVLAGILVAGVGRTGGYLTFAVNVTRFHKS